MVKNNIHLLLRLLQISVVFVSLQIILINHLISFDVHPNYVLRSSLSAPLIHDSSTTTTTTTNTYQTKPKKNVDRTMTEDQSVLDIARNMLSNAGTTMNENEEKFLYDSLNDSNYFEVYGKDPIILGKENCQAYREKVPAEDRLVAPMGTFNTGTNLLHVSLNSNCAIRERQKKYGTSSRGFRHQVSWGKHSPSSYRGKNKAAAGGRADFSLFFPIVILKDPFTWMQSFCRHWYGSRWIRPKNHCPNLIPINQNEKKLLESKHISTFEVTLKYKQDWVTYSSMVDLWNTWYNDYVNQVDFPRLIIRFEDMLFNIEKIVSEICECVGGEMEPEFQHISESAKDADFGHRGSSNLLQSIMKYGNTKNRFKDFSDEDKDFAMQNLETSLMETFHYSSDN